MALKYKTALKALGIAGLTAMVTTPAYAGPVIPILVGAAVGVATAAAGITILGLGVVATAIAIHFSNLIQESLVEIVITLLV